MGQGKGQNRARVCRFKTATNTEGLADTWARAQGPPPRLSGLGPETPPVGPVGPGSPTPRQALAKPKKSPQHPKAVAHRRQSPSPSTPESPKCPQPIRPPSPWPPPTCQAQREVFHLCSNQSPGFLRKTGVGQVEAKSGAASPTARQAPHTAQIDSPRFLPRLSPPREKRRGWAPPSPRA